MEPIRIACGAFLVLVSACSDQFEVKAARERIAQLEAGQSELKAAKERIAQLETGQSELKTARERIAKLEAELAAERAKQSTAGNPSPPKTPGVPKPDEKQLNAESTGQQWVYEAREDKMTGGTTRYAAVFSTNTVNFGSPYSGEQHGTLTIRTDPKYGRDVIFSIERGQLLCRSYEDCEVLVRFDNAKPERFAAPGPADNSTESVFLRNYDRFLSRLRKAKTVRLSMNVYQEGAPVFEFDVDGFNEQKYTGKK